MPPREPKPTLKRPEFANDAGFLRLRNGLREHIRAGAMSPNDFSVYSSLHFFANWKLGIYYGTAGSIAALWTGWERKDRKHGVQESLERLRKRGYIDYPTGNGERGNYPILINKAEPTLGVLRGWRLRLVGSVGQTDDELFVDPFYEYVSPTPWSDAYGDEPKPTDKLLWRPVGSDAGKRSAHALLDEDEEARPALRLSHVLELTRRVRENSGRNDEPVEFLDQCDKCGRETSACDCQAPSFTLEDEDDELA